jgi:hypothetical protein
MNSISKKVLHFLLLVELFLTAFNSMPAPKQQSDDASPPDHVVKLIFIHHSTGENWLTDGYGDLGKTLDENNYFVSDTNYGWGPEAIGDRTDIPNWTEWFAGENTSIYMEALLNENGQHASYTRTLSDPGGENEIVMFKSCFPNSALEGNPNDAPDPEGWLSVGHAKYVYNEILQYFATRPDKLFVVITAPPLSDSTYAANARAFNDWLLNDWLRGNNYTLNNVAVFDFYNVLTSPDAHHRFDNGSVEYSAASGNTLYYPSEDDHPSVQGSQKATDEFVPLLNVFYHRWKENAPAEPPATVPAAQNESTPEPSAAQIPANAGLLDDFESDALLWEPFWDEATATSMKCASQAGPAHGGERALLIEYNIAPNSWGTCAYFPESPQDWSANEGLTFSLHTAQPGIFFDVNIYAGTREDRETYLYEVEAPAESAAGYAPIIIKWADFHRADWEDNAGAIFAKPNQIAGMAFGLGAGDSVNAGSFWVDDLSFLNSSPPQPAPESTSAQPSQPEQPRKPSLPCGGAIILPLALVVGSSLWRKKRE